MLRSNIFTCNDAIQTSVKLRVRKLQKLDKFCEILLDMQISKQVFWNQTFS